MEKTKGKRRFAFLLALLMTMGVLTSVPFTLRANAAPQSEGDYYVSYLNGDDTNDGTSPDKAWKTLEKVNSVTFKPGERILLDNRSSWEGQLYPKGSGTAGKPIIIDKYGAGDRKPLIQGNGIVEGDDLALDPRPYAAAVFLYNQQYWEINNLEVTNYSEKTSTFKTYNSSGNIITKTNTIPSKYGILVVAKDSGTMNHIYIRDCNVHAVNADPVDNRGAGIGRGGIIFLIRGKTVQTRWNDIIIENNKVGPEITHYGINFLSTWVNSSSAIFPHESGLPTSEYAGKRCDSTNLIIRGNYCVDVGNAAISPTGYENCVIERNVSDVCNSGTNGNVPIWWQIGTNTIVQYNEVFGTGASASKEDSQAFDGDLSATENIVQYNYTHDNPSGSYFECALGTVYTTHYRYNISVNDGSGTNSHGGGAVVTIGGYSTNSASKLYAYNNDMYIGPGQKGYIANSWDSDPRKDNLVFTNNVIYSDGNSRGWETKFKNNSTMVNNFYGGSGMMAIDRADDTAAVYEGEKTLGISGLTAQLCKTMEEATGWENTAAYLRGEESVLHGAGANIPHNGGLDFFGNKVSPFGAPAIGAQETGADFTLPEGVELLDFESGLAQLPGIGGSVSLHQQSYKGATFATSGWTAVDSGEQGIELVLKKSGSSSSLNRITIPKGYVLYGFTARTPNSAKVTMEWNGISKDFYLSSVKNSFLTGFEKPAAADKAVSISVSSPYGVSGVYFDDLILKKAGSETERANVALNKPATQNRGYNSAAMANDGNMNTFGGNTGSFPYIWQVDLQDAYALDSLEIEWEDLYTGENKTGDNIPEDWKYTIEASLDSENWEMVVDYSQANPYTDQTSSMLQSKPTNGLQARYLKVTVSGKPGGKPGAWAVLPEFRAFGTRLADLYTNVALDKTATQNAGYNDPALGNDGDTDTWAGNTPSPYTWSVDLGGAYSVKSVEIEWEDLYTGANKTGTNIAEDWKYKILYSLDNEDWDTAVDYSVTNPYTDPETSAVQTKTFDTDIEARYFRVILNDKPTNKPTAWYVLPEFRAFGIAKNGGGSEEPDFADLAYAKPVRSSGENAEAITDGTVATSWKAPANGSWAQIDLGLVYAIESARVTATGAYTLFTSQDGENWAVWWNDEGTQSTNVPACGRYLRIEADTGTDISLVQAWGSEAATVPKTVMVLAPHPDDEALMSGGVIHRALEKGDRVVVLLATLGDYNGISSGKNRMAESINAMQKLGLPVENMIFLNYGDQGGLEQFSPQKYTDSMLYQMYVSADPTKVFTSRAGQTATYDGVVPSYHMQRYGEQGAYTRETFLGDLQLAIGSVRPDEIYTTSRFDLHADHATIGLFAGEAIVAIRENDPNFNPTVYEALIHSCAGDNAWPVKNGDAVGVQPFSMPANLETATPLRWNERVSVTVPEAMRVTPFANNLKDQSLRQYTSQYSAYIGSFAKYDEVFWTRDYSGIAYYADVTASSESANADGALDQSATKAVDGVRDGYSTSLSATGFTSHNRFPYAEWATNGEKAGAWLQLDWDALATISEVKLYDRPNPSDQVLKGTLTFSDGSSVEVGALPNDGTALSVSFQEKTVTWVRFTIDEVSAPTTRVGLAEIEVYGTLSDAGPLRKLRELYEEYKDQDNVEGLYTDDSWADLEDALEQAAAVLEDNASGAEAVTAACEALKAAVEGLAYADLVSMEQLVVLCAQAGALVAERYTVSSFVALAEPLAAATDIVEKGGSVRDIREAYTTLKDALDALMERGDTTALEYLVAQYDGAFTELHTTAAAWNTFAQAMGDAKGILADSSDITQPMADAAVSALDEAVLAMLQAPVNVVELQVYIGYAEEIIANPDKYVSSVVQPLTEALEAARQVLATRGNQAEVDAAAGVLLEVIGTAFGRGDTTDLARLAAFARGRNETLYTAVSWSKLVAALRVADEVLSMADPSDQEVEFAYDALRTALDGLVIKKVVDYSALDAAIVRAQDILAASDKYVASTIVGLPGALQSAQAVRVSADADQTEVDTAAAALALENANARLKADLSKLQALLAEISKFNFKPYTMASVEKVTKLVKQAQQLTADNLQKDVDAVETAIRQAMKELEKKPIDKPVPLPEPNPSSPNPTTPVIPAEPVPVAPAPVTPNPAPVAEDTSNLPGVPVPQAPVGGTDTENSVDNGAKAEAQPNVQVPMAPAPVAQPELQPQQDTSVDFWMILFIGLAAVVTGGVIFFLLWKRRKKNKAEDSANA